METPHVVSYGAISQLSLAGRPPRTQNVRNRFIANIKLYVCLPRSRTRKTNGTALGLSSQSDDPVLWRPVAGIFGPLHPQTLRNRHHRKLFEGTNNRLFRRLLQGEKNQVFDAEQSAGDRR